MRSIGPIGSSPDALDLERAFQTATRGVFERAPQRRAFVLYGAALGSLLEVLALSDRQASTPRRSTSAVEVRLEQRGADLGTLRIQAGGRVRWWRWDSPALVADPEALDAWLGARELDAGPSEPPSRPTKAPEPLAPYLDRLLAPEANVATDEEAVKALRAAEGDGASAVWALCAWLGREDHPLAHRLLTHLTMRVVLKAIRAGLPDVARAGLPDVARAGLRRWLVASVTTRAADLGSHLSDEVQAALLEGAEDGERERLRWRFGGERLEPEGTALLAVAQHGRLHRVVRDGSSLYARDGADLARFDEGERTVLTTLYEPSTPLAVRKDEVWFLGPDGRPRTIPTGGGEPRPRRGPLLGLPARRLRKLRESFARERDEALAAAIASESRLLTLDLDEDVCDAHAAFGGAPPTTPRGHWAADLDRRRLWDADGAATDRSLAGQPRWLGLGADPDEALLITEADGSCVLWRVSHGASPRRLFEWGSELAPVGAYVADDGYHIHLAAPLGDCVVRIADATDGSR